MNGSAEERFCTKYSVRFEVGNKSTLVYSATDQSARIIPHNVASLLDRCRDFKTLEQHAQDWTMFLSQRQPAETVNLESIKRHISSLAADGLLISEKTVLTA